MHTVHSFDRSIADFLGLLCYIAHHFSFSVFISHHHHLAEKELWRKKEAFLQLPIPKEQRKYAICKQNVMSELNHYFMCIT